MTKQYCAHIGYIMVHIYDMKRMILQYLKWYILSNINGILVRNVLFLVFPVWDNILDVRHVIAIVNNIKLVFLQHWKSVANFSDLKAKFQQYRHFILIFRILNQHICNFIFLMQIFGMRMLVEAVLFVVFQCSHNQWYSFTRYLSSYFYVIICTSAIHKVSFYDPLKERNTWIFFLFA